MLNHSSTYCSLSPTQKKNPQKKANDIFERCHQSTAPLARLKLPEICTVEIGEVVKVFAKPKVVVIELYKPLALGDVILFRRVRRDSFGAVVTRGGT